MRQYSKWYWYWLPRNKWGWIWNRVEQTNAMGDHRHKFQCGPIGLLVDHYGKWWHPGWRSSNNN